MIHFFQITLPKCVAAFFAVYTRGDVITNQLTMQCQFQLDNSISLNLCVSFEEFLLDQEEKLLQKWLPFYTFYSWDNLTSLNLPFNTFYS